MSWFEEDKKIDEELEEEMEAYCLDEEEKELVRSGEYEPWDFELPSDDDLVEGDYYEEDEK